MFSVEQQPRIGEVVAIKAAEKNPIAIRLWRPHSRAASWIVAKYRPDPLDDDDTDPLWISTLQVRFRHLQFTESGHLTKSSQRKMGKAMSGHRDTTTTTTQSGKGKTSYRRPPPRSMTRRRTAAASHRTPTAKASKVVSLPKRTPPVAPKARRPHPRYNLLGVQQPDPTVTAPSQPRRFNARYNLRRGNPSEVTRSKATPSSLSPRAKIEAWACFF